MFLGYMSCWVFYVYHTHYCVLQGKSKWFLFITIKMNKWIMMNNFCECKLQIFNAVFCTAFLLLVSLSLSSTIINVTAVSSCCHIVCLPMHLISVVVSLNDKSAFDWLKVGDMVTFTADPNNLLQSCLIESQSPLKPEYVQVDLWDSPDLLIIKFKLISSYLSIYIM